MLAVRIESAIKVEFTVANPVESVTLSVVIASPSAQPETSTPTTWFYLPLRAFDMQS